MTRVGKTALGLLLGLTMPLCAQVDDTQVLYVTPFIKESLQTQKAAANWGSPGILESQGNLHWFEDFSPMQVDPNAHVTRSIRQDTGLLRVLSDHDWSTVKDLVTTRGAPATIRFRSGSEFMVRAGGEVLIVEPSGSVLDPGAGFDTVSDAAITSHAIVFSDTLKNAASTVGGLTFDHQKGSDIGWASKVGTETNDLFMQYDAFTRLPEVSGFDAYAKLIARRDNEYRSYNLGDPSGGLPEEYKGFLAGELDRLAKSLGELTGEIPPELEQQLRNIDFNLGNEPGSIPPGKVLDILKNLGVEPGVIPPEGLEGIGRQAIEDLLALGSGQGTVNGVCSIANGLGFTHCSFYATRLISSGHTFCTGTLISDRHILTAAHCVCDKIVNGSLSSDIRASVGVQDVYAGMALDPDGVRVFDRTGSTYCADAGVPDAARRQHGDLAILTLADGALEQAKNKLVNKGILPALAERIRATLPDPEMGEEIWSLEATTHNIFRVVGFGDGPNGADGLKRTMDYSMTEHLDCLHETEPGAATCTGIQNMLFHDPKKGLCAADSGSGVFKWAQNPPEGYGNWVLMAVVSGDTDLNNCNIDGSRELMEVQYPRNVLRIDTPMVREWILDVVGADIIETALALAYPPFQD